MHDIRVSAFIVTSVDLVDIRIDLCVFSAVCGKFLHEVLGVPLDAFELDDAVLVIAIGELAISDGAQGRCSSLRGGIKGAIHLPSGALQRFASGVRLVPLDGRAVGDHLAVPRQVVALLVHVEHGGGLAFPTCTSALISDCGRIVHHEVLADVHTAIGAHV